MPTHIAHICLCLPTHDATQRQSQKSAIANALFRFVANSLYYLPTFAPMKFFTLIFSVYILALSILPCGDQRDCNQSEQTAITATTDHENHNHEQETCTPFCICACCGSVFSNLYYPATLSLFVPTSSKNLPVYQNAFVREIYFNIWQPPKIS